MRLLPVINKATVKMLVCLNDILKISLRKSPILKKRELDNQLPYIEPAIQRCKPIKPYLNVSPQSFPAA